MRFLDLPDELLTQILGHKFSTSNYALLSLVNRRLREIVRPLLHQTLAVKIGNYSPTGETVTEKFVRERLLQEPDLAGYVQHLELQCLSKKVQEAHQLCLDCLRATYNIRTLSFDDYVLKHKPTCDDVSRLLLSGSNKFLNSITIHSTICGCKLLPLFAIPTLRKLNLGYYSSYEQEKCQEDHGPLLDPNPATAQCSSVSDLTISVWEPSRAIGNLLKQCRQLVKFSGRWGPSGSTYRPSSVSDFLIKYKDTLQILSLGASLDKDDEYEPQDSDGSFADFSQFSALRKLAVDVDIVLGEDFSGDGAENLANRLPSQLETLQIFLLPRIVSVYAHKPEPQLQGLDKSLVWARSLSRAKHEKGTSLRQIIAGETSYLPGPLEGPYLSPILSNMWWKQDEKLAWSERGPYPFKAAGIDLSIRLVFVVRGWTRRPSPKRPARQPQVLETAQNEGSTPEELWEKMM